MLTQPGGQALMEKIAMLETQVLVMRGRINELEESKGKEIEEKANLPDSEVEPANSQKREYMQKLIAQANDIGGGTDTLVQHQTKNIFKDKVD